VRILVLGGDGMLGHQLFKTLAERHVVKVTLRQPLLAYARYGLFNEDNSFPGVDAHDQRALEQVIARVLPDAIVNGIGIVKQRSAAKAAIPSIEINSLFPHRVLELCQQSGARLIHLSTDCVFSGRTGNYREADLADATDLYGRSKLLGEVSEGPGLTLRTSIIGLELSRFTGLIEWFLAQRGTIRGFRKAIYTGFTTRELSRIIERVIVEHRPAHGVWHVASSPINKYDLLLRLAARLGRRDVEIIPDDEFLCDRSLCGAAFEGVTGYSPPSWDHMLTELAAEILVRGQPPDESR
jgi:dTDP-4-dehydrorhamnose reductase